MCGARGVVLGFVLSFQYRKLRGFHRRMRRRGCRQQYNVDVFAAAANVELIRIQQVLNFWMVANIHELLLRRFYLFKFLSSRSTFFSFLDNW